MVRGLKSITVCAHDASLRSTNMHLETRPEFVAAAPLCCVRSTCSIIGHASIRVVVVVDDLNEPLAAICQKEAVNKSRQRT